MGMKPMLLVGVAVLGLGLLLHIVGMATPAWSTASASAFGVSVDQESGPWKSCTNGLCSDASDWTKTSSKVEAVQAMTMIGVLAGAVSAGAAILLVVLSLLGKDQIKILPLAAAGAGVIAFVFVLLGVIIWGAAIHADLPDAYDIGYSFALSIVGGIGLAVGGVLVYMGSRAD